MSSNNCFGTRQPGTNACSVIVDTYQVFDSCRDRDCFEDTRVFLDELGARIIEHTGTVRTKSAEICTSAISVEPVGLSRGFYRVTVRFYIRLEFEACLAPGKPQCFSGLAVTEKSVVLFGGEGSHHVFRQTSRTDGFCQVSHCGDCASAAPTAVVEAVDPIVLATRVLEPSACCPCCCCCIEDLPDSVVGSFDHLVDESARYLAVSLGIFSVIRLERPGQFLVNAVEYSVPDKECPPIETGSPCEAFKRMAFPTEAFGGSCACPDRGPARPIDDCGCGKSHS